MSGGGASEGAVPAGRSPFWVSCAACRHEWVAAWLPMELTACAELLLGARCPMCGGAKVLVGRAGAHEKAGGRECD